MVDQMNQLKLCVLDIETTGLRIPGVSSRQVDEVIQLAIVSESQTVLFNELFKPVKPYTDKEAQKINGLTEQKLKNKRLFAEHLSAIQSILDNTQLIITYNADFDTAFLKHQGVRFSKSSVFCMMQAFTQHMTKQSKRKQANRWYSLAQCASYFGVTVDGKAHDALTDARTTLLCYLAMCESQGLNAGAYPSQIVKRK